MFSPAERQRYKEEAGHQSFSAEALIHTQMPVTDKKVPNGLAWDFFFMCPLMIIPAGIDCTVPTKQHGDKTDNSFPVLCDITLTNNRDLNEKNYAFTKKLWQRLPGATNFFLNVYQKVLFL